MKNRTSFLGGYCLRNQYIFMTSKKIKSFALFLLLFEAFSSCSAKRSSDSLSINSNSKIEEFSIFYDRYLNDSLFQMSRIKFPLPGINTEEMSLSDTVYYWHKETWALHKNSRIDTSIYNSKKMVTDTLAVVEISLEDSGFLIRSEFRPIDGKWYLTYYIDSNL